VQSFKINVEPGTSFLVGVVESRDKIEGAAGV